MFRFFLKCILLIAVFFVGVLLGVQKANTGILNMRGYEDPQLYGAVSIENKDGEVNASFLGKDINSHDLQEKKEKLQDIKAFNAFSSLGKKTANGTKKAFEKLIDLVVPD
ncbi:MULTISPECIES: YqxA family protein [Bacillus]|uniref:YqxA family protein n=1 Tax=Bacillus TaxID=1386 RepID=UPI0003810BC8|nr:MULTISPECIES: YqxA family protein [Bacillus]